MNSKHVWIGSLLALFLFFTVSCKKEGVELTSVTVTGETEALAKGKSQILEAEGTYSDGTTATIEVKWSVSDPSLGEILAVSGSPEKAVLQTLEEGELTVRAEAKEEPAVSAYFTVTVFEPVMESIVVSPGSASVPEGLTAAFSVEAEYSDGTTAPVSVEWSSSDEGIATVDGTGTVTTVSLGEATITATTLEEPIFSDAATVTVLEAVPVGLAVSPASASLEEGCTLSFTASVKYSDGSTGDPIEATWTSADGNVAVIDASGTATGVAAGVVTLTATAVSDASLTGEADLTVVPGVVSISVTPGTASVVPGNTQSFTATGTYSDQSTAPVAVTWSSSNTTVATIDASGVATGHTKGTATITAAYQANPGVTGSATLTVAPFTRMYMNNNPDIDSVPFTGGSGRNDYVASTRVRSILVSRDKQTLYMLDGNGALYGLDLTTYQLQTLIASSSPLLRQALSIDAQGNLFAAGYSYVNSTNMYSVEKIDPSTWTVSTFSPLGNSTCYHDTLPMNGDVYVATWGGIARASSGAAPTNVFTSGMNVFTSIAADANGDLYTVEFWNKDVWKLTDLNSDGNYYGMGESGVFKNYGMQWICEVEMDAEDSLYVAELQQDASNPSHGIWKLRDLNNDGDAVDAGEGSIWCTRPYLSGWGGGGMSFK